MIFTLLSIYKQISENHMNVFYIQYRTTVSSSADMTDIKDKSSEIPECIVLKSTSVEFSGIKVVVL